MGSRRKERGLRYRSRNIVTANIQIRRKIMNDQVGPKPKRSLHHVNKNAVKWKDELKIKDQAIKSKPKLSLSPALCGPPGQ